MKSEYCSKCGHKNVYSLKAPKFCSNCGEKMASALTGSLPKQKVPRAQTSLREDETAIDDVPHLSELQYEIEQDAASSFTLGSLFKNNDEKVEGIAREELKNLKSRKDG